MSDNELNSKRVLTATNASQPSAAKTSHVLSKNIISMEEQHPELNFDALSLVMEFLGPRDLFHMAFTCKTLRNKITVPLVVRSAMIHGRHAKKTIEELSRLMKVHAMHPPSALRLLRLVNGRLVRVLLSTRRSRCCNPGSRSFCVRSVRGWSRWSHQSLDGWTRLQEPQPQPSSCRCW